MMITFNPDTFIKNAIPPTTTKAENNKADKQVAEKLADPEMFTTFDTNKDHYLDKEEIENIELEGLGNAIARLVKNMDKLSYARPVAPKESGISLADAIKIFEDFKADTEGKKGFGSLGKAYYKFANPSTTSSESTEPAKPSTKNTNPSINSALGSRGTGATMAEKAKRDKELLTSVAENFEDIDENEDGKISNQELATFAKTNDLSDAAQRFIRYNNDVNLLNQSSGEGITQDKIETAQARFKEWETPKYYPKPGDKKGKKVDYNTFNGFNELSDEAFRKLTNPNERGVDWMKTPEKIDPNLA